MSLPFYTFVNIGGNLYPVASDTYNMKWSRAFSSQLAGNIIRLNFIDRGPGIRVWDMTIILDTWPPGSLPHQAGIILPWDQQLANLEASYGAIATVLEFVDPWGRSPTSPGAGWSTTPVQGVFFTNLNEIPPKYSTPNKPYMLCEIELTEATQPVN
jgi:hypothetical protein